jgi:hypothetical protein
VIDERGSTTVVETGYEVRRTSLGMLLLTPRPDARRRTAERSPDAG